MRLTSLRPAAFDFNTGAWTIDLFSEDARRAYSTGKARYLSQRKAKTYDGVWRDDGPVYLPDIEGVLAEIAFWLLCGMEPPKDIVLTHPEWERQRGAGGELLDVLGNEIRATVNKPGRIIVHRKNAQDKDKNKDEVPFVLANISRWPVYPDQGFSTGDPELDALLGTRPGDLQRYDTKVVFSGWAYGREATEDFQGMRHPDTVVPEGKVRRMDEEPEGALAWPASPWPDLISRLAG